MKTSIFEFGNEYVCRSFFDIDNQYSGVEIYNNKERLGSIVGLSIPDEDDEEEVKKFEKEVIDWIIENE